MKKIVGMFPGQGSQSVGMGKALLESSEIAKDIFSQADSLLGFSLSTLCLEGPIETLTLTQNAQPAILTVSHICHQVADIPLLAAAGHSLGEFTALVAAGSLSFADAVQLVHKRGSYMQEAVPAGKGTMAAVMGPAEAEIAAILAEIDGIVEIANLNCPGQTVIAGEVSAVEVAKEKLSAAGAKVIPLNVSAPFHCSLMKPAAERLAVDLEATTFNDLAFPVYANITAKAVTSGADARALLVRQVTGSVRWTDSILAIQQEVQPELYVEFGNGDVLSKLLKRIDGKAARAGVSDLVSAKALIN